MASKNSYFPIILLGGLAIYYFSRLKVTGDNLKVNLVNVLTRKGGSGLSLPKLILVFNIQNVTNNALQINAIVGDIFVNGNYLANLSNLNTIKVAPKSSTYFEIELQTSVLDALPIVKDLIFSSGKRNLKFTGNLTVNANGILIPIKIEKTIL